ncbi:Short-chain dehydrogenase/reductase SDR [Kalmanozyma brasiliensis GHG001]|uniref:Short-chain dehydrogenase n=1 Tax=Kalmanozyma brasiliensis (strain GHG001) TaxID=1365824 RepID=V5E6W7_KALBG|nr:Short-chain dehydrogenase/reductase SDR [Kalmanozyma brasiliensis GHG001]EST06011.1 Short-chain dehydrogenase/reductase SDR [Kalmanozyma brasiliensis GHG001]
MQTVKHTIAENLGVAPTLSGDPHQLVDPQHQFSLDQVGDLSGKVALVTGGSEGIGFGCTHTLLKSNIDKVFVVSLSEEIISQAKNAFAEDDELPKDAAARIVWKQCDLTDWKRVQQVAREINQETDRLDILIANAAKGIMTHSLDRNGIDSHMSINHLGHVVLIDALLPLLNKTVKDQQTKVRVVSFSSNLAAQTPNDVDFATEEDFKSDLGAQALYARSKLADLLFSRYLNRKYSQAGHSDIVFNACHPGVVDTRQTNVWIHEPFPILGYAWNLLNPIKKSIFQGCVSAMYCATQPTKGGNFICPPAVPEDGPEKSRDEEMQDRLVRFSKQIIELAGVTLTTIPV